VGSRRVRADLSIHQSVHRQAHWLAAEINTGVLWVNSYGTFDPTMPFGGSKMSGWGKELSRHSIDEYIQVKGVWINTGS
jgi:acyl-CoA reductase-like NAD-dependent aldehyde dehydrogenase